MRAKDFAMGSSWSHGLSALSNRKLLGMKITSVGAVSYIVTLLPQVEGPFFTSENFTDRTFGIELNITVGLYTVCVSHFGCHLGFLSPSQYILEMPSLWRT